MHCHFHLYKLKQIIWQSNWLRQRNYPRLLSNLASNAINKFERKISGKGAVKAGKRLALFISTEDMNDIMKIIKS